MYFVDACEWKYLWGRVSYFVRFYSREEGLLKHARLESRVNPVFLTFID